MATTPLPPAKIQQNVRDLGEAVKGAVIRNTNDYIAAGQLSKNIAAMRRAVDETFDPIISKAHEAHQEALAQKKKFTVPLDMDQRYISEKIMAWDREQEEIRRKQEAELSAQKKQEQEDQAIAEAQELVRQGETGLAEIVLQQEAEAPAPVVALPKPTPRLEGFSKRVTWRFRIEDESKIPREYLRVDEIKIGGVVRALKGATKIAGVKVYSVDIASHKP